MVKRFFQILFFGILFSVQLLGMQKVKSKQQGALSAKQGEIKTLELPMPKGLVKQSAVTGKKVDVPVQPGDEELEVEDNENTDEAEGHIVAVENKTAHVVYPQAYFDRDILRLLLKLMSQETKGIWGAYYECEVDEFIGHWAQVAEKKELAGALLLSRESKEASAIRWLGKSTLPLWRVDQQVGHTGDYKAKTALKNNFEHMHNKILIFESNVGGKPLVVIGSFNATDSAVHKSLEDIVVLDDPDVIAHYIEEFHVMHKFSTALNSAAQKNDEAKEKREFPLKLHRKNVMKKHTLPQVAFRFAIRDLLKKLISDEQERIDGAQFVFTLYDVAQLWHKMKISGELIINSAYKKYLVQALELLKKHGVTLKSYDKALMHHKFLIFAKNCNDRPVLLVGSANMTGQAIENNWENVVALEDASIIEQFRKVLAIMSAQATPIAAKDLVSTGKAPYKDVKIMNGLPL